MSRALDFPRPLGVPGGPHVGDLPRKLTTEEHEKIEDADFARRDALGMSLSGEEVAAYREARDRDLSVEATPPAEDIRNALTILAPVLATPDTLGAYRLLMRAVAKLEGGPSIVCKCGATFSSALFDMCMDCRRDAALESVGRP